MNISLRALEIFLLAQGKKRGYNEKQEVYIRGLADSVPAILNMPIRHPVVAKYRPVKKPVANYKILTSIFT